MNSPHNQSSPPRDAASPTAGLSPHPSSEGPATFTPGDGVLVEATVRELANGEIVCIVRSLYDAIEWPLYVTPDQLHSPSLLDAQREVDHERARAKENLQAYWDCKAERDAAYALLRRCMYEVVTTEEINALLADTHAAFARVVHGPEKLGCDNPTLCEAFEEEIDPISSGDYYAMQPGAQPAAAWVPKVGEECEKHEMAPNDSTWIKVLPKHSKHNDSGQVFFCLDDFPCGLSVWYGPSWFRPLPAPEPEREPKHKPWIGPVPELLGPTQADHNANFNGRIIELQRAVDELRGARG